MGSNRMIEDKDLIKMKLKQQDMYIKELSDDFTRLKQVCDATLENQTELLIKIETLYKQMDSLTTYMSVLANEFEKNKNE